MTVATDKTRVSAYIRQDLKEILEKMAEHENRSISNFLEILILEQAKQKGYIND